MALDAGIGYFVVDNIMECDRLVKLSEEKQKPAKALLRINPGISAHTHEYIMTSKPDSKFGIYIENREHIDYVIDKMEQIVYIVRILHMLVDSRTWLYSTFKTE